MQKTDQMNPKLFLSHAGEDKDFAIELAKKLRDRGVDTWLDVWELLPGDSLVERIFEEGIKNAKAVIIILSKDSVDKKWVREELNAAFVRKINGSSKLIPVVVDECKIPEALQSTLWIKIKDFANCDLEFEQIVRSIYDHRERPPLGAVPAYATSAIDVIPDLTTVDCLVLKIGCEEANRKGHALIDADTALREAKALGISEAECYESLQILDSRVFVRLEHSHNRDMKFHHFNVTPIGYEEYAIHYVDGYESIVKSVALQILNHDQQNSSEISTTLEQPIMMVNHIIGRFEARSWVKVIRSTSGDFNIYVYDTHPRLKRLVL